MKKGFTLIELLVVIGIICILAGILLASFSGGTESARTAQCLTNMRNLATACQTYGMATGRYPGAGSYELFGIDESDGIRNAKKVYYERPGWISWNSEGAYESRPQSHAASMSWFTSCYEQNDTVREYALTNGAHWKYLSENRRAYTCPAHRCACPKDRQPLWSYVMNSYFYWDRSKGSAAMSEGYWGIEYHRLRNADKRLLFAEIPFTDTIADPPSMTATSGLDVDCTLQYRDADGGEYVGFNHKVGKKDRCAHVVFADAHVEKILMPKQGMDRSGAKDLTKLLCEGKDYILEGSRYKEMD